MPTLVTDTPTYTNELEDLRGDLEALAAKLFGFGSDDPDSPLRSPWTDGWLSSSGTGMVQEAAPLADKAHETALRFRDRPDPPPEIERIRGTLYALRLALRYIGHHPPEIGAAAVEEIREVYFIVHSLLAEVQELIPD